MGLAFNAKVLRNGLFINGGGTLSFKVAFRDSEIHLIFVLLGVGFIATAEGERVCFHAYKGFPLGMQTWCSTK